MPLQLSFNPKQSTLYRAFAVLVGLFPLTIQGSITLAVAALALSVFGYGRLDLVVFSLAICALAILVFSLFCSVISGVILQRRIQRIIAKDANSSKTIELEAGYPNETGFFLPTLNFFPLVKLSWQLLYPDYMETRIRVDAEGQLVEEVVPLRRCLTDEVIRQFSVSDVLGFCRYSWRQKQLVRCMALPKINSVKPLPLLRSLTAEDGIPNPSGDPEGDRMEIRPYAPGDSVRNIMWKVFARNRQLNVRLAEKSVFHSKRTVAYLLSSQHDEAAAAVARIALESGALGEDWAFAADGSEKPCEDLATALQAVAKSRAINAPFSYGLDNFLQLAGAQSGCHCIVFAAAEKAHWLPQLRNTIGRYPGQFSLVMATDGVDDSQSVSHWRRIFLQEERQTRLQSTHDSSVSSSRRELLELLTDVGQLVESLLIVDRKTGFSFDKHLRKV